VEKEMKYIKIAALCSQIINAVRLVNGEDELECFDLLEAEEQNARVKNVMAVINDLGMSMKRQHDIWMNDMLAMGWKWGEETDRANKIHNCLVNYEDLNFLQKLKDHLFIETVKFYAMEAKNNGNVDW
jgi:hypothetical protein